MASVYSLVYPGSSSHDKDRTVRSATLKKEYLSDMHLVPAKTESSRKPRVTLVKDRQGSAGTVVGGTITPNVPAQWPRLIPIPKKPVVNADRKLPSNVPRLSCIAMGVVETSHAKEGCRSTIDGKSSYPKVQEHWPLPELCQIPERPRLARTMPYVSSTLPPSSTVAGPRSHTREAHAVRRHVKQSASCDTPHFYDGCFERPRHAPLVPEHDDEAGHVRKSSIGLEIISFSRPFRYPSTTARRTAACSTALPAETRRSHSLNGHCRGCGPRGRAELRRSTRRYIDLASSMNKALPDPSVGQRYHEDLATEHGSALENLLADLTLANEGCITSEGGPIKFARRSGFDELARVTQ